MSTTRFVTSDGLPALLAFLSQNGRRVLVPVEKPANKRSVVYEPWSRGMPFIPGKGHRAAQGGGAAPV